MIEMVSIAQLIEERNELRKQLQAADELVYAPGEWKCEYCGFVLVKKTFYAQTGQVGMDRKEDLEGCPNDGSWMKRVTWKEIATDLGKRLEYLVLNPNQNS